MSILCPTALRRPKSRWGKCRKFGIWMRLTPSRVSVVTLRLFQGVCQDHQASVHGAIQPVHPERGCSQRHFQHQQRCGGAAARAGHHQRRPLSAEQAAGGLMVIFMFTPAPPPLHQHRFCINQHTANVALLLLSAPHVAADVSKWHKSKELFNPTYCFSSSFTMF